MFMVYLQWKKTTTLSDVLCKLFYAFVFALAQCKCALSFQVIRYSSDTFRQRYAVHKAAKRFKRSIMSRRNVQSSWYRTRTFMYHCVLTLYLTQSSWYITCTYKYYSIVCSHSITHRALGTEPVHSCPTVCSHSSHCTHTYQCLNYTEFLMSFNLYFVRKKEDIQFQENLLDYIAFNHWSFISHKWLQIMPDYVHEWYSYTTITAWTKRKKFNCLLTHAVHQKGVKMEPAKN